ncbi:MAG: hypothetical protein JW774_03610 [Candidatus Aureabacteria bacterium]|nr:hypothetical protein [Candidatus Auribacterota bacterium]
MALSSKDKKQIMMIVGLVIVMGIIVFIQLSNVKKKKSRGKTPPKTESAVSNENKPSAALPSSSVSSDKSGNRAGNLLIKVHMKDENKDRYLKEQNESAHREWGLDPFYPNFAEEASAQLSGIKAQPLPEETIKKEHPAAGEKNLKLTGISRIGNVYYATINRSIVGVGGAVKDSGGAVVKQINPESVIVDINGGRYELHLEK